MPGLFVHLSGQIHDSLQRALMKALLISMLMLSSTAQAVDLDKKKHFAAAGAISAATYLAMRKQGISRGRAYGGGIAAAMLVGVLKEIIDPKFDWKDVGYDALGAVTVPLLVISW